MSRRFARCALATLVLAVASVGLVGCSKKEEPPKPTTALEDLKKIGDDAVKSSNEMNEQK